MRAEFDLSAFSGTIFQTAWLHRSRWELPVVWYGVEYVVAMPRPCQLSFDSVHKSRSEITVNIRKENLED